MPVANSSRSRKSALFATSLLVFAAMPTGCVRAPVSAGQPSTTTPTQSPAIALPPNNRGYVRVELPSSSAGCSISVELVACQRFSGAWIDNDGQNRRTASVGARGDFHWVEADLGELKGRLPLGHGTYRALEWDIAVGPNDTRFTDRRSGHGMTVDARTVTPF